MNSLGQYYYDYSENLPLIDPNLTPDDPWMAPNMTELVSPRRFKDLDKMIKEINPEFDSRKYWAYGCHCFALNDRPSSSMGRGKPVDELDTLCKKYKECQKCAQKRFGEVFFFYFKDITVIFKFRQKSFILQLKYRSHLKFIFARTVKFPNNQGHLGILSKFVFLNKDAVGY